MKDRPKKKGPAPHLGVAYGVDPIIVAMISRMNDTLTSRRYVEAHAGLGDGTIKNWSSAKSGATLMNARAALEAMGLDLVVVDRATGKTVDLTAPRVTR